MSNFRVSDDTFPTHRSILVSDNGIEMRRRVLTSLMFFMAAGWITANARANEPDYGLLNRIASCESEHCVMQSKDLIQDKTGRTVLYTKWLLLNPSSQAASRGLLENIPTTDHELMLLFTLPDWHEGATTSAAQMKLLDQIYEAWPRLLGAAALRFPQFLSAYIRYGRLAVSDIHSDYTGYERTVCRANHSAFLSAFSILSSDDQAYIRTQVFDPDHCKPIFLSEAD